MVPLFVAGTPFYVQLVTTPEADSMAELIADCADIPARVLAAPRDIPLPRNAAAWSVDDACQAQVLDLDVYV